MPPKIGDQLLNAVKVGKAISPKATINKPSFFGNVSILPAIFLHEQQPSKIYFLSLIFEKKMKDMVT